MDELVIWWLDQAALEYVCEFDAATLPDYLETEIRSAEGRAGRGRLWVPDHIEFSGVDPEDWPEDSDYFVHRAAMKCAGIVLPYKDALCTFGLPGFLTNTSMFPVLRPRDHPKEPDRNERS